MKLSCLLVILRIDVRPFLLIVSSFLLVEGTIRRIVDLVISAPFLN
jgi:hypothetical protein